MFSSIVPTKRGQEIHHRLRHVTFMAVLEDIFGAVAFAEFFLAVNRHDVRQCGEDWLLDFECLVEVEKFWRATDKFLTSEDVRNLHDGVINDMAEVIGWEAVAFYENKIIDCFWSGR